MDEPKRHWWSGWADSTDPTRDFKLLAFAAAVVASIYWLGRQQARGPITAEWVDAFKWFLLSVSIGGGAWTVAEKLVPTKPPADNNPQGPQE
jgi:hypothetical protein